MTKRPSRRVQTLPPKIDWIVFIAWASTFLLGVGFIAFLVWIGNAAFESLL